MGYYPSFCTLLRPYTTKISAILLYLLAAVIISAISYGDCIIQKYFFRQKGYLFAGIAVGIYFSTARTVVIARKAKWRGQRQVCPRNSV